MEPNNLPALRQPRIPEPTAPREPVPTSTSRAMIPAPAPLAPPTILSAAPNLWSLLAAFRRRWRLATSLGLLVGALSAALTWYLTDASSFTASAQLDVDFHRPKILFDTIDSHTDFATYRQTQVGLIRSRMVLNKALRDPRVAKLDIVREQADPIDWLGKQIQVDIAESPQILRISMTGKDSAAALAAVDAVREAYMSEHVDKEREWMDQRYAQLEKLYGQYENALETHKKRIETLAQQASTKNDKVLGEIQSMALAEVRQVRSEILELQSRMRQARSRILGSEQREEVKKKLGVPEDKIEEMIRKERGFETIQKEIAQIDKDVQLYELRSPDPKAVPAYVELKQKREDAVARRDDFKKQNGPIIAEELLKHARAELERQWAYDDAEFAKLTKWEAELQVVLKERGEKFESIGTSTLGLQRALEEKERLDPFVKKAATEVEALKVESQAPPRIRRRGESYVVKRDGIALKAASGAGALGLLAVVFGVSLLEFRSRRVSDVKEVSEGLRLPVVGTMPLMRSKAWNESAPAWDQMMIESVDAARTLLLHVAQQKKCRVIMVSSAVAGEGKTLLSTHLAASLARAGYRALLIDGDLRRPSLHKIFGLEPGPGFSEALRGEVDIRETVQVGPTGGLWVISAGQCDTLTMRALAQGNLKALLERIKPEYDMVIVDSAPILPVADSQLLARDTEGVLLSVLRNVSRLPLLFEAYQRLAMYQVELIGAVVHGTHSEAYATQYPYLPVPPAKAAATRKEE
jgi:capsular exopolysaccharide synthesis family protein